MRPLATFYLGELRFGVDVARVRSFVRAGPLAPVPLAPPGLAGLANLRGEVVPAIDLAERLGLPSRRDAPFGAVVHTRRGVVSLLVDRAGDVEEVDEGLLAEPPEALPDAARACLLGSYRLGDRPLVRLDLERLLARDT